jgi:signal transduction histidine kinase
MQLAANAVAHTPPGTIVEIGSAIEHTMIVFTVTDHGPGIPPEQQERVFERFARLDTRRTGGTGLGLSIVAAICAAHGGTVRVGDRPGGGAVFSLSIPYRPAAALPAPPHPYLEEARS